jgi:hypothetical protein
MKLIWTALLIVASTTLTALVVNAGDDRPNDRAEPAPHAATDTGELDLLRQKVRALDEAQSRLAADVARPKAHRDAPAAKAGDGDEAAAEQPAPARRLPELSDHLAAFEQTLETGDVDPEWSPKAEAELKSTVAALALPGISLEEATCKQTICKMKLALGEGNPGLDLNRALLDAVKWRAPRFIYIDGDTTHTAVAYFAREGHELPVAQ